jgi:hypothetical protein
MCGFAEELEFLDQLPDSAFADTIDKKELLNVLLKGASATADFYIDNSAVDGIPYWDTGAPGLANMGDYLIRPSEPFNDHEPVDSSAASITAQGLLRLGNFLQKQNDKKAEVYTQAGLTVAKTLLSDTYLSLDDKHEGLILHSVYHRPNGWDNIPKGKKVPCNESSMWGDYHARELMLFISRMAKGERYHTFYNGLKD